LAAAGEAYCETITMTVSGAAVYWQLALVEAGLS